MKTPFVMSNRSIIVTYWMVEGPEDSFHFSWSNRGNEAMTETYAKNIGKDVVADVEGVVHCSTHPNGGTSVELSMVGNPKGSIPDMIKNKMAAKSASWFDQVSASIKKNKL